ncbi:MAG: beta-N-acetylhexosaminidase [Terriglobales bacterium]
MAPFTSSFWTVSRRNFLTCVASTAVFPSLSTAARAAAVSPMEAATTSGAALAAVGHPQIPVPSQLQFTSGRLPLAGAFGTVLEGAGNNARLARGVARTLAALGRRTGLELGPLRPAAVPDALLVVRCAAPGPEIPTLEQDESYRLTVTPQQAVLEAGNVVGALRGLATLQQLLSADAEGFFFPAVHIEDAPRFRWRGLMIDVCRHWHPASLIKRQLDGMELVKLNVLHWHLSEDQGFRVESHRYPKLTGLGSDGRFYTQDEVREVIAYAADRGIRVLPEFDMPGHSTAWMVGYPELGSAPGPFTVAHDFGVHNNVMDPTRESTYKFLDGFFQEMTALFPDAYFHIGGDENNGKQWQANPRIQQFMRAHDLSDTHALQAYFNQRISPMLTKYGKKMVGWEEILNPALPHDIVVQAWIGTAKLAEIARNGNDAILSAGYYLDLQWPAADHYLNDPIPEGSNLTPEQTARVLGGEACMWSEFVSSETIESRLWPRLAPIAERLWSPASVRDVDDMYRRMAAVSLQLEDRDISPRATTQAMFRRLAAGQDPAPLEVFAEVLEPNKGYSRGDRNTQFTPLSRFVDAVPPESAGRRAMARMVADVLAGAPAFHADGLVALQATLERWQAASAAFPLFVQQAPQTRELAGRAASLGAFAGLGLAALAALRSGVSVSPSWRDAAQNQLTAGAQPDADVIFVVLQPLLQLVFAAASLDRLRTSGVEVWHRDVLTAAAAVTPKERR